MVFTKLFRDKGNLKIREDNMKTFYSIKVEERKNKRGGRFYFARRFTHFSQYRTGDFPCGTVDKNPPANAGDMGSIPDPGRFDMPRSN